MRGVNDTPEQLLDLCFALQDEAAITPYYFYTVSYTHLDVYKRQVCRLGWMG